MPTLAEGEARTIVVNPAGPPSNTLTAVLPPGVTISLESVLAAIDATGAGDTIALLEIADSSGAVIARKAQGEAVTGGQDGSATWALRLDDEKGSTAGGGDYVFIAEQTPDGGGQIIFAAIPQTFRHLVLVLSLSRTLAGVATAFIKWNNATLYDSEFLYFNSLSTLIHRSAEPNDGDGVYLNFGHRDGAVGTGRAYEIPSTGTSIFAEYVVQIPWYTRADRTHRIMWQGAAAEGTAAVYTTGSGGEELFNPPAAITALTVGTGVGAFAPDSLATLYGVT